MTTILTVFLISLFISLLTTPISAKVGMKIGAVDLPDSRKVHSNIIPRIGGLAILFSFVSAILLILLFDTAVTRLLAMDRGLVYFGLGAVIIFVTGFVDDICHLRPGIKLVFQIIGASFPFMGGVTITYFDFIFFGFKTGAFSYFATVAWFLLFINSVNLIDGLDGLAGGVSLFVSIVMIIVLTISDKLLPALLFAALAGSILGFLRYNFNPASVFMGDSGSYFIGYLLAGLSIIGSAKMQIGTAMLIPILSLGVPIIDTLFSPIRRFVIGQKIFQADRDHIHHRLLQAGFSKKNAVLIIYGISILLGAISLILVNFQNETIGFFLTVLAAFFFLLIKKIGYFEYFAIDKIYGWFRDITDEAGITHDRRSFLNIQMEITRSSNEEDLWFAINKALIRLNFDMAEMELKNGNKSERAQHTWRWARDDFRNDDIGNENFLKLELPLIENRNGDKRKIGRLLMIKDLNRDIISYYTLRRVEHLRRAVTQTLRNIEIAQSKTQYNNIN